MTMISQSSKSVSDPIPVDILIDIFLRVPGKSIARFRCVSKFWKSILGRQDFTELFLTKSLARPRLFFALQVDKEFFVFSTHQPQNPEEHEQSSPLVATPYKACPKYLPTKIIFTPLYGLLFLQKNLNKGRKSRVICNPVTGESVTLPEVKEDPTGVVHCHFGFDPIKKQFKVLCSSWSRHGTPNTHRVLTLQETGELLWRTIQNPPFLGSHYLTHFHSEICINGVVYYRAYFSNTSSKIVCFDFRSEEFVGGLINMDKDMLHDRHYTLFNYKGHLGAFWYKEDSAEFWVLEDAGNHKWSKHLRVMPFLKWDGTKFVGMASSGELVFSHYYCLSNNFYISYYSTERDTHTTFEIEGFEEFFKHRHNTAVHTFLDYAENMKFM